MWDEVLDGAVLESICLELPTGRAKGPSYGAGALCAARTALHLIARLGDFRGRNGNRKSGVKSFRFSALNAWPHAWKAYGSGRDAGD